MVKITYQKRHPSDPDETSWDGRIFKAGEAVDLDGRENASKSFIERAKGNPWFDVDDGSGPAKRKENPPGDPNAGREPATPEEYRRYAIDWINKAKSLPELEGRWNRESELRGDIGWAADDQALIDPILQPKLQNMKRAAEN